MKVLKMKRSRPEQHRRRLPSGRSVVVNKGVKKRKVYKSRSSSNKRKRPLGTNISYKDVGRFQTAFDEHGNFRGSRVLKTPVALDPQASSSQVTTAEIKALETDYYNRRIDSETYHKKLNELLSLR